MTPPVITATLSVGAPGGPERRNLDTETNMYRMKQYKGGDVHVTRVPNPQAKDGQQTPEAARRILP